MAPTQAQGSLGRDGVVSGRQPCLDGTSVHLKHMCSLRSAHVYFFCVAWTRTAPGEKGLG